MDENTWESGGRKFVAVPEIEAGSCDGCAFKDVTCYTMLTRPACTKLNRDDKRDIIWKG